MREIQGLPEIARAFALRSGLESYDSFPDARELATSFAPASPPIVNSEMPTPVHTGGSSGLLFREGSRTTFVTAMPSLSSRRLFTVPSDYTVEAAPAGKAGRHAFRHGGGAPLPPASGAPGPGFDM